MKRWQMILLVLCMVAAGWFAWQHITDTLQTQAEIALDVVEGKQR